ncbi:MAG: glycosyltransferase family 1 protein [Solirubrobacterales bacterium]
MRIAIELTALELDKGGTARAAESLVELLREDPDTELLTVRHRGREPKSAAGRVTRGLAREFVYFPVTLPRWIKRNSPDLLHCPAPLAPTRSSRPVVVTVHDVIPWDHPEWMTRRIVKYQQIFLPKLMARSAHVITSSDYSRRRMIELFDLSPERITTVPLPIDPMFTEGAVDRERLAAAGVEGRYVLTVGTLQPRKNIDGAIAGYERMRGSFETDAKLVIVGARGWRDDELMGLIAASPFAEDIVVAGRVEDATLVDLYRAAECFVFPSRYEGFGYPPLEAMACGTPVVSSDRTSLAEAVGDAADVIDPDDSESIGAALGRVLTDRGHADQLRARGRAQAARFTNETFLAATLAVYERVLAVGAAQA